MYWGVERRAPALRTRSPTSGASTPCDLRPERRGPLGFFERPFKSIAVAACLRSPFPGFPCGFFAAPRPFEAGSTPSRSPFSRRRRRLALAPLVLLFLSFWAT